MTLEKKLFNLFIFINKGLPITRGHKQCWHFARGIIPQLGKTYCIRMPFRIASRTAHTAERCGA